MNIRRRRFERKFPAPPKTPDGFVWLTRLGAMKTELVPIAELEQYMAREMDAFDNLPPAVRAKLTEVSDSARDPDAVMRAQNNGRLAAFKIGVAR